MSTTYAHRSRERWDSSDIRWQDSAAHAFLSTFGFTLKTLPQRVRLAEGWPDPGDMDFAEYISSLTDSEFAADEVSFSEDLNSAFQLANKIMKEKDARDIRLRHIFAALITSEGSLAKWLETTVGAPRLQWMSQALRDWPE